MIDQVMKSVIDPTFMVALVVAVAVFVTVFTALPAMGGNPLKARMKSVALEREELRAKQRMHLAAEADRRRKGLREEQSHGMRRIVERLDLKRALADENTITQLKVAGFRGQNPLTRFLFFRLVLPMVVFSAGVFYVFVLGGLPDQFAVPKAAEAFEDNGHLKNKESQETFKRLIQKLARAAHVLHGSP